ncbi:MAG TPA: AI-2E family transporter [Rhizomicrobium sp.]|nr:AI-2E family transporter [Rhizomicrobium sp.]
MRKIEDLAFVFLIVSVTFVFAWLLRPFYGAILWSVAIAILFRPLHLKIKIATGGGSNIAAVATLILVISSIVVPSVLITASLGRQASGIFHKVQSGDLNFAQDIQRILDAAPPRMREFLNRSGIDDSTDAINGLAETLADRSQHIAAGALGIGLGFVDHAVSLAMMLYLLFYLLRDGDSFLLRIKPSIPLRSEHKDFLLDKISLVMRSTIKGSIAIAIAQGTLGGLAFWFLGISAPLLWGIVMAVLSLLPAIGAAIVWLPVAVYLLATGSVFDGLLLIGFGLFVIGLADNLLRPFLIGRSAQLPNYIVLLSTLGGIEIFGLNGFIVGPLVAAMFFASWELFRDPNSSYSGDG